MKPSPSRWLAVSSLAVAGLLALVTTAFAATRPQYGGALRIEVHAATLQLDPTAIDVPSSAAQRHIDSLLYENLVTLDSSANPAPALAVSWQHDPEYRRWEFQLRPGVRLHSDALLTPAMAAESLQRSAAGEDWRVNIENGNVVVQSASGTPLPDLLPQLALARHAIVRRNGAALEGTGPFRLVAQGSQKISLVPNEFYWRGRPYLDRIDVSLGVPFRQQLIDLEAGSADLIEVEPGGLRRVQQAGHRVTASAPDAVLLLAFNTGHRAVSDPGVREAIANSIDRQSIASVLFQHEADPSAALLPQWISGYSFLFSPVRSLPSSNNASGLLPLVLDYDFADPVAKLVADRIAVNARDAGVAIQTVGENLAARPGSGDLALRRLPVVSLDPKTALLELLRGSSADLPAVEGARSPEDLFRAESSALADNSLVPIAQLPEAYATSSTVRDWSEARDGSWNLPDVWIAPVVAAEGRP